MSTDGESAEELQDRLKAIGKLPLPPYTAAWGPQLARPTTLPDSYDKRIDPEHIFVFSVHPVSGIKRPFYVTARPCENCAKIRQVCSRTRPQCRRCVVGCKDCVVGDGWVKLSGPKCEKPKLKKRADELEAERPFKKSRLEDEPDGDLPRRRTLRPRVGRASEVPQTRGSDDELEVGPSISSAKKTSVVKWRISGPGIPSEQNGHRKASGRGRGRGRGGGRKASSAFRSDRRENPSECCTA